MKKTFVYTSVVLIVLFSACKKETDNFNTYKLSDYSPMQVGKYITYNLDSLLYINFGTKDTTVHYQVKYEVDAAITDNLGRPAFRIIRYIRKNSTDSWNPDNSFMAINTGTTFEFVENNLRFLKLVAPITDGFSWKGNKYIDTYSDVPNLKYLDDWDYIYTDINSSVTLTGGINVDSTITVSQRDEVLNDPANTQIYSEVNKAYEQYAKGIGMVYKKFLHREYQPPTPGTEGYALGYGITLSMIDHN
jgi:hypothetical protein